MRSGLFTQITNLQPSTTQHRAVTVAGLVCNGVLGQHFQQSTMTLKSFAMSDCPIGTDTTKV